MFKKYDYVEFNDGQIDGILTEQLEDGYWNVEFHTGNGGGNFDVHESEMHKCDEIPKHYQDVIDFLKESYEE